MIRDRLTSTSSRRRRHDVFMDWLLFALTVVVLAILVLV